MFLPGNPNQSFSITAIMFVRRYAGALIAVLTLWVMMMLFGETVDQPYSILLIITGLLGVILLAPPGQSDFYVAQPMWQRTVSVAGAWIVLCGILLLLGYATKSSQIFSRRLLFSWALISPLMILLVRWALTVAVSKALAASRKDRRIVIAGASEVGQRLANQIQATPQVGLTVAGFFDDRSAERLGNPQDIEILGSLSDVQSYVKKNNIPIVFVALPIRNVSRVTNLLDELQDTTTSLYFVPDVFVFDLIQSRAVDIMGIHALALCETPFYGMRGALKRAFDVLVAGFALTILSPLLIAIAVAIKLSSPGSVIFKQRRYGLDGREIIVYKFRSMTVAEDSGTIRQATVDDDRITGIGRFLRKYSLDELPQFVNVLQGRMSVVGPRPHAVAHNEEYRKLIKGYMVRHKVLPGITGLAQVSGYRGETETIDKMQGRIEMDLQYLRQWSLMLDVRIIFRTAFLMFSDKAAY